MTIRRGLPIALLASAILSAAPAGAEPEPEPAQAAGDQTRGDESERSDRERRLRFRADRVELGPGERLELSGDVQMSVDRYRLTSDRLEVERTPRGVVVDGTGQVAFCPCENPPVSIGFRSALVAPPTDLVLEQPTVRVGPVPVAWLPYLWLRSPRRLGMLPPRVAWRGDDGLLLGSGVHVPLDDAAQPATLDVSGAGYVRGGAEVLGRLNTERTTTNVRWDHLGDTLLAVDARGSVELAPDGAVAWDADLVRGARGLEATILLEEAAKRYDRAQVASFAGARWGVFGIGARADDVRGGALDEIGAVGPRAILATSGAILDSGSSELSLMVRTVELDGATTTVARQEGNVSLHARPGPFAFEVAGHLRGAENVASDLAGGMAAVGFDTELSLPLVRDYGQGAGELEHWIVPRIDASVGGTQVLGTFVVPTLLPAGVFYHAAGGAKTLVGSFGRRSAASLEARAGWIGTIEGQVPAAGWRAVGSADWFGIEADGAHALAASRSAVSFSKVRVGRRDSIHVGGYAQGQVGRGSELLRLIAGGAWNRPFVDWLDRPGWTLGGALGIPWTRFLASAVNTDYDPTHERLLSVRGALAYRHPCGCVALVAWSGKRLGRDGFDAWLTADLIPR